MNKQSHFCIQLLFLLAICFFSLNVHANTDVKPHGLIQVWHYLQNETEADASSGARFQEKRQGISIRRADLLFRGDYDNGVGFRVLLNLNNSATFPGVINDVWISYRLTENLNLRLGQFLVPTCGEGLHPSGQLLLAERSFLGNRFGMKRDVGAALSGRWKLFDFSLALLNGNGQNQSAESEMRQVASRIVCNINQSLKLAVWENFKRELEGDAEDHAQGVEFSYQSKDWTVKSEFANRMAPSEEMAVNLTVGYELDSMNQISVRGDYFEGYGGEGNVEIAGDIGYNRFFSEKKDFKLQTSIRVGTEKSTGSSEMFYMMIVGWQYVF